jgi:hypothetical protein
MTSILLGAKFLSLFPAQLRLSTTPSSISNDIEICKYEMGGPFAPCTQPQKSNAPDPPDPIGFAVTPKPNYPYVDDIKQRADANPQVCGYFSGDRGTFLGSSANYRPNTKCLL